MTPWKIRFNLTEQSRKNYEVKSSTIFETSTEMWPVPRAGELVEFEKLGEHELYLYLEVQKVEYNNADKIIYVVIGT